MTAADSHGSAASLSDIELRTYHGDSETLARFLSRVWQSRLHWSASYPVWDPAVLDWQLIALRNGRDQYHVAAYHADQLVGCLFSEPFDFRIGAADVVRGANSSWLSVDPSYRGLGLGNRIADETRRRLAQDEAKFLLGFTMPGRASLGRHFWAERASETSLQGKLAFWVRVLDYDATASSQAPVLAMALRAAGRALGVLRPVGLDSEVIDAPGVRSYVPADLQACLELVCEDADDAALACVWTPRRLAHQLLFGDVPQTLVVEQAGRAVGFINFHVMSISGRMPLRVAVVDCLIERRLACSQLRVLFKAAVARSRKLGAAAMVVTRCSGASTAGLVANGFVPFGARYDVVVACCAEDRIRRCGAGSLRALVR
jgi:hypothetical protein